MGAGFLAMSAAKETVRSSWFTFIGMDHEKFVYNEYTQREREMLG
jgi:hypothetical protein